MGERLLCTQKVIGSIPLFSTKLHTVLTVRKETRNPRRSREKLEQDRESNGVFNIDHPC